MFKIDLSTIPQSCGVYLFKGAKGEVLYVGKAKDLRARLSSYFKGPILSPKVVALLQQAFDLEYFLTQTEKEALLLEATFIKKYRPKYNVLLKDDKNYPMLRLSLQEEYPALQIVRRRKKGDRALYFGPFTSARGLREILKLLSKLFPLRKCSLAEMQRRKTPCVYYQIKKCLAPCVRKVSPEEYAKLVEGVVEFFQGKGALVLEKLKREMEALAERLEFERAAFLRDRIKDLEAILEKQAVVLSEPLDLDLWEYKRDNDSEYLIVLFVRYGYLYGYQTFHLRRPIFDEGPTLKEVILQYYLEGKIIPELILVPEIWENREDYAKILTEMAGKEIKIEVSQGTREYIYLRTIAQKNLDNFILSEKRREKPWFGGLAEELKRVFRLENEPRYIEALDLSQYYGKARVGAIVAFFEGEPEKSRYRHYRIKGEGKDDFSMLYEVLYRRLKRGLEEGNLPDLILIDGGKGHLETALRVAEDLGITNLAIRSVAKNERREPEKIYIPGRKNPLFLPRYKDIFHFVGRIMQEAHRFALSFAEKTLQKENLVTLLDRIPGIGPKRKEILLKHIKNLEDLKEMPLVDLARLPGFNRKIAKILKEEILKKA
uniref:UvrABC system protein C n=1 Tax=Caldimicrobium thiodismutans TaxID=1653476 RepID=A0A832GLI2_9BACT